MSNLMTAPSHTHPTWTHVVHVCLSECVCVTRRVPVVGELSLSATAAETTALVYLEDLQETVVQ